MQAEPYEQKLQELGQHVHARRQRLGLTEEALARKAGVSRATIYRLEQGGNPTLSSLIGISSALRIRARDLVTFDEAALKAPSLQ